MVRSRPKSTNQPHPELTRKDSQSSSSQSSAPVDTARLTGTPDTRASNLTQIGRSLPTCHWTLELASGNIQELLNHLITDCRIPLLTGLPHDRPCPLSFGWSGCINTEHKYIRIEEAPREFLKDFSGTVKGYSQISPIDTAFSFEERKSLP